MFEGLPEILAKVDTEESEVLLPQLPLEDRLKTFGQVGLDGLEDKGRGALQVQVGQRDQVLDLLGHGQEEILKDLVATVSDLFTCLQVSLDLSHPCPYIRLQFRKLCVHPGH